ncbi:MAG: hypothetical protein H6793_02020 [Candidatus Nomurabacteria bacterium]|nr:MAG: hypothetical protein H6793_02020 [Candidatus Nomurabacteria bacterium]
MNTTIALKNKFQPVRKSKLPVSLRTHKDEAKYLQAKQRGVARRPLYEETPIQIWNNWMLIENQFPYNAVFDTHHMLVPRRGGVIKADLSKTERQELEDILDELSDIYDCYMVNYPKKQSIKSHYHIHLLTYKTDRRDLKL